MIDFIKIKILCSANDKKWNANHKLEESIHKANTLKCLNSEVILGLLKLNNKRTTKFKNSQIAEQTLHQSRWKIRVRKDAHHHLSLGNYKARRSMYIQYIFERIKYEKLIIPSDDQDAEQQEFSSIASKNVKYTACLEDRLSVSYVTKFSTPMWSVIA